MAFSTSNAKRQPMSPEIRDWCVTGSPAEIRTLLLRLSPHADMERLTADLRKLGAEILSAGPAVAVASLACRAVPQASQLPDVLRVESPRRMSPKLH